MFTGHLLATLGKPGLEVEQIFKQTRTAVVKATSRRQVPWTSSSLIGEKLVLRAAREMSPSPPPPVLVGVSAAEKGEGALGGGEGEWRCR